MKCYLGIMFHLILSASAATRCPAVQTITTKYLQTIKSSNTNIFYPSAYFNGSAVKLVSASGMRDISHPFLCVDGTTVSSRIYLYDDGTHGDDVAGDGIFTRACVHFCQSVVDFNDIWGFAYQQNFNSADLTVVQSTLKGQIPYHVVRSPKYPNAKIYVTSHAAFFVDDQQFYMPTWPLDFIWDYAGARNVAVSAILDIFGDVFDWFSMTPFDFNMQFCPDCKAIPGAYNMKFHGWEHVGGATAFRRPGELGDCNFAMTGFPITRMVGGVSNEDMLTEFLGQIHEWLHGAAGFSYHRFLPAARAGDGMHVPGTCTTDHSQLQAPLWDWVLGYPTPIPTSYCVGIPNCYEKAYDLVRLQPNEECNDCPDSKLATCCSFRYEDAINTRELMLSKPELYQASPLLQYIAGVLPYGSFPNNKKVYYCMGADTDSGCGLNSAKGNCTVPVRDSNRSRVTSPVVTRFTLDELIQSVGGRRNPPSRKERAFRSSPIHIGQRPPSEAEMVFWTQFWRYQEQERKPWTRATNVFGNRRVPIVTWLYTTNGRSTIHSRFHGVPCGGGLQVQSCSSPKTVCDSFACGKDAKCYPYDGRPLCVCNDGFWGDGNLCQKPSVSASYPKIYPYLWNAHELYFNGSNAEYYPKYSVKEWCYGDQVDWPSYISKKRIAPYPGGLPKYALMGCRNKLCTLSERCHQGVCIPLGQPTTPTAQPTSAPVQVPTLAPTSQPTTIPSASPTSAPSQSILPSSIPSQSSWPSSSVAPSALPSQIPAVFFANFARVSIAVIRTERRCKCASFANSLAVLRERTRCTRRTRGMFFRKDLNAGRVQKGDKNRWMRRFDRKLKQRCR